MAQPPPPPPPPPDARPPLAASPSAAVWDRLPTPVHFDSSALLSPPLSRESSPRRSPLAIHTDLHPALSPLPSPAARHGVGKKTSAFFAAQAEPTPSPPPRAATPSTPHSANLSFFFAKGSATPTPPPSIRSFADDAADPAPKRLPPLRALPARAPAEHDPHGPRRAFVTLGDPPAPAPAPAPTPPPSDDARAPPADPAPAPAAAPTAGAVLGSDVPLTLVRALGQGAFSCVWLARDAARRLGGAPRLRSASLARTTADRVVQGLRPQVAEGAALSRSQSIYLEQRHGEGATAADAAGDDADADEARLVAVKMMDRTLCDANNRTRISFVREVEVLRHISHPSIVAYLHSFTTPTHHCLVLEALLGGELFELLDQDDNHSRLTEPLLRRMFGELCQAVGWMHGVGLVHRDLKLENILLTVNPFRAAPGAPLPSPLVKLTDFGLARFIDPAAPLLATRCGSAAYAAPEIVTGAPYDGRATDAWACGVVLFALAARALPFAGPMRVAHAAYAWPPAGDARLATDGVRRVVARLLVRAPAQRARVVELWDEPWMRGEGAPAPPLARAARVGADIPSVAREEPA